MANSHIYKKSGSYNMKTMVNSFKNLNLKIFFLFDNPIIINFRK